MACKSKTATIGIDIFSFDKKLLLEKAEEADNHRRSGKPVGPLHGIPVALKDIIGTYDMPTECGTVLRKGKTENYKVN